MPHFLRMLNANAFVAISLVLPHAALAQQQQRRPNRVPQDTVIRQCQSQRFSSPPIQTSANLRPVRRAIRRETSHWITFNASAGQTINVALTSRGSQQLDYQILSISDKSTVANKVSGGWQGVMNVTGSYVLVIRNCGEENDFYTLTLWRER